MGPSDEKDVLQNAALLQVSSSVSGTGRAPSTARYFLTCLVVAATFTGLVLAFWAHGFHQVQESSLVSGGEREGGYSFEQVVLYIPYATQPTEQFQILH